MEVLQNVFICLKKIFVILSQKYFSTYLIFLVIILFYFILIKIFLNKKDFFYFSLLNPYIMGFR